MVLSPFKYTSSTKVANMTGITIFVLTLFIWFSSDVLSTIEYTVTITATLICLFLSETITTTITKDHIHISQLNAFTFFRRKNIVINRDEISHVERATSRSKNASVKIHVLYYKNEELLKSPSLITKDLFFNDESDGGLFDKITAWGSTRKP